MKWDYKLPRKQALINIIGKVIDNKKTIDIYEIADEVEKYIKATHLKRRRFVIVSKDDALSGKVEVKE